MTTLPSCTHSPGCSSWATTTPATSCPASRSGRSTALSGGMSGRQARAVTMRKKVRQRMPAAAQGHPMGPKAAGVTAPVGGILGALAGSRSCDAAVRQNYFVDNLCACTYEIRSSIFTDILNCC